MTDVNPGAGGVFVPAEIISFLLGEGSLDGLEFGDKKPGPGGVGQSFWWRHALRKCRASSPVAPAGSDGEVVALVKAVRLCIRGENINSRSDDNRDEADFAYAELVRAFPAKRVDAMLKALAARAQPPAVSIPDPEAGVGDQAAKVSASTGGLR